MPRTILSNITLLTFVLAGVFWLSSAHAAEKNAPSIQKQVASQQQKIKRVQSEIEDHRKQVQYSQTKELNLLAQMEIIDKAIHDGRERLKELKGQVNKHEDLINIKTEELSAVEKEKEIFKEHIKKRLAAYYKMGDIGVMNVAFSAGNLPDLLNFKEYFMALVQHDQQVVSDYREKIKQLETIAAALEDEKDRLLEKIVLVKQEEDQLATVRKERLILLAKVNTEKKLYQRAIEEMEEASTKLTETLAELRGKLVDSQDSQRHLYSSPKKKRPGSLHGFSSMRGRLIPPARGAVTTFFGKNTQGKFDITTYADGIDIKTLAGSEIYAIYSGKVVYAGQLKGYGNLIIIDHGEQYYSLISRAAELYREEGDIISTGEVIGIMDDQGGLLGEGLHFEIRYGTEPEDPLKWVNNSLLNISSSHATASSEVATSENN